MSKNEKLSNISIMKCIMMIMVVLYHSCLFYSNNWFTAFTPEDKSVFLKSFAFILNTFHIQSFTMASGFLYYYIKEKKENNIKENIKKRFSRLMIPYFFTSIFYVIPICAYFYHYNLKDVFLKYVLMTSPAQLWFLVMLFVIYVLFQLLDKKIVFNFKYLLIIFILSVFSGFIFAHFNINYFQISRVATYFLYFYFGGYIYNNVYKVNIKIEKKTISIIVLLTISLLIYVLSFYESNNIILKYSCNIIEPVLSLFEILLIYLFFTKIVNKYKNIDNNRVILLLEKTSFGIYLFHQQIIYFVIMFLNGKTNCYLIVLVSFVLSFAISLLLTLLLRKNTLLKKCFGL